jgi:deoxycytidylate deaminase
MRVVSRHLFGGVVDMLEHVGIHCSERLLSNHVACLVKNMTSVVSVGTNGFNLYSRKGCCGKSHRCMKHAEVDAIGKAASNRSLKDKASMDLVVIRVNQTGKLGMSRPCYHCIRSILNARFKIDNVYYSNAEGDIICEKPNELLRNGTIHITIGLQKKIGKFTTTWTFEEAMKDKELRKYLLRKSG